MRLTVHIEDAPFMQVKQKNVGTKDAPIMKPKKSKCIMNTLSFPGLKNDEIQSKIGEIRKKYTIAKWKRGLKRGQEMIYITNEK